MQSGVVIPFTYINETFESYNNIICKKSFISFKFIRGSSGIVWNVNGVSLNLLTYSHVIMRRPRLLTSVQSFMFLLFRDSNLEMNVKYFYSQDSCSCQGTVFQYSSSLTQLVASVQVSTSWHFSSNPTLLAMFSSSLNYLSVIYKTQILSSDLQVSTI